MLPFRIELDVRNVDNRALEDRPPYREGPGWARREYAVHLLKGFGRVVVLGNIMEQLTVICSSVPIRGRRGRKPSSRFWSFGSTWLGL
jgi:hypothetical protein